MLLKVLCIDLFVDVVKYFDPKNCNVDVSGYDMWVKARNQVSDKEFYCLPFLHAPYSSFVIC